MLYDTRPVFYADNRQQIRELINETTRFYGAAAFSPLFRKSRRAAPIRVRSKTEHARELVPLTRAFALASHRRQRSIGESFLSRFISTRSRERNFCERDENARSGNTPTACFLVNRLCESKSRNGHPSTIYKEFRDSRLEEMPLQPMNHSGFVVRDSWYSKEALSD